MSTSLRTYTLTVIEKVLETPDTVTISFKQPALKKIKYLAGQYLTVICSINGRRYLRPYSFSSAPRIDPTLDITIKRIPGGIVSNHFFDKVQKGDLVEIMEPMGDFIIDETRLTKNSHVVLWGAGSGITPLFSIAKVLLTQHGCKVTLAYGNRDTGSVIFHDKIKVLENTYPLFSVWHFHTCQVIETDHPNIIQGRVHPATVLNIVNKEGQIENSFHYICGPAGLKESVKEALASTPVKKENIRSEDFELIKEEKDFTDIITRIVEIKQDDASFQVEVVKGKSILEAGLDAMIALPYSCQTGNCSVCRGRIISGRVRQIVKRHADLTADEYQLCCTYPLTEDVKVIV